MSTGLLPKMRGSRKIAATATRREMAADARTVLPRPPFRGRVVARGGSVEGDGGKGGGAVGNSVFSVILITSCDALYT